jgi:predicted acylesterase/phospholipase RssA
VPDPDSRDVAIVLSGGGINGVMLELGFLRRLSEAPLWPRVGWIYGTSAGALTGTMAALDRLDDLEEFLLGLQPGDAFRPRPVWQFPGGLHDYTLPATIAERIGAPAEIGAALAAAEVELVVYATDVSDYPEGDEERDFELEYSSRSTEPDVMGRAILASAAISGLVLPMVVDAHIATDGGWVRNFPFEHAYRNPAVAAIAAFRYVPSYPPSDATFLARTRERLERFRAVPPVRSLLAEVRLAQDRASRGEPAHYGELIVRLMRVAFARNAVVEERRAQPSPPHRRGDAAAFARSSAPGSATRASRSGTTAASRRSSFAGGPERTAWTRRSAATSHGRANASAHSWPAATRSRTTRSRRRRTSAPTEVGRGPGRRSDPVPMRGEQAPAHRGRAPG